MDGEIRAKADKTKVLIIVGVNIGVIMLAGIVGIMCYTKKTHLQIYHKLPGLRTVPEASIWQLASMGDLTDRGGKITSGGGDSQACAYRDYEPDLNEKARKRSIFVPLLEESVIEEKSLQLGQRLGGGIFGDTYIAEWTEMQVTVKRITLSVHENQLSTEFLKWMKDEVWLLSRQRHRNIVSILGLCLESRHPYVISEYVDGQCVKDFIKRGGGLLNWPLRVKLLSQIADGMAFLHSTKPLILHRDLRCANLFITERDIVKVGDFGLIHLTQPLRSACQEEDCCCQGKYSACPPSIAWTAPEVFEHPNSNESDGFITKAADVYSFGIVMWEIVMCEDPFDEIGTTKEVCIVG
ncbi:hypothetical protein CHS0354_016213 [Potamilus streckersoni]|uniref:Protein kinase domain-containing protein n=1 Tax=Potamilus streckersoni TaxID=2493646 RepID=A0AAE0VKL0_9BIVA|nr:hypothetical protein CHS0354_016213 [Potamilus streckersoni]